MFANISFWHDDPSGSCKQFKASPMSHWKDFQEIQSGISMFGTKSGSKVPVTGQLNTQDSDFNYVICQFWSLSDVENLS